MPSDAFERIWNSRPFTFVPDRPEDLHGPCEYAVVFQAWVDALLDSRLRTADIVVLNQLKIILQDRYFSWRAKVPHEHQTGAASADGHRCIFAVYEEAVEEIYKRQLLIEPPLVTPPPPPSQIVAPSPVPRSPFDGLLVGEIIDPEFDGE